MSKRLWLTVLLAASVLLVASGALSAPGIIEKCVGYLSRLPWQVVAWAIGIILLVLLSLAKTYRTWAVRRLLVRTLVRWGVPPASIARRAGLSQDGVALIAHLSSGKRGSLNQEDLAASPGSTGPAGF